MEVETDKLLEKAYQLFESVVVTLQVHIQNTKEDKKKRHPGYECNSTHHSQKLTKCCKITWKNISLQKRYFETGLLITNTYFSRPDRLKNRFKRWKREKALKKN